MLKHYFNLLKQSVVNDVRQKYAGSQFGLGWAFLYPLFFFGTYVMIYTFIFRVKPVEFSANGYVVYILSGLVPFLSFSEAITSGTSSIIAKRSLLLNTIYPSEFIPLQTVLSAHVNMIAGVVVILILNALLLGTFTWMYLLIPIAIILQIFFVAGVVWFLSIVNLVVRDIQQLLGVAIMLLMIMSPVAYTPSMVPDQLKWFIWLNPFSYFVRSFQDIFVYHHLSSSFFIMSVLSIIIGTSGYIFFKKVKAIFYDYV